MSDENPAGALLENLAKASAVAASLSLFASIVYDWGFFIALGISFLEIPSTLSDHVHSALLWAPGSALSLASAYAIELVVRGTEHGMTEEQIVGSTPDPELTRRRRQRPFRAILYILPASLPLYFVFGAPFLAGVPFGLSALWILCTIWIFSRQSPVSAASATTRRIIRWLPPVGLLLFFTGYVDASRLFLQAPAASRLSTSAPSAEQVVVLRQLERGILLRDATRTISFRPWSEVKALRLPGAYVPAPGVLCSWFKVGCPAKQPPEP